MERAHVLLTGGTGFFGLALLRQLQISGLRAPQITILSRNPEAFRAKHPELASLASWIKGDILLRESLPWKERFSHILHGAADSTQGPSLGLVERYTQIVDGTRNLLDLALATATARFLLVSSGGVYGVQPRALQGIPEDYFGMPDPLNAENAYSVAKRTAEHLCGLYRKTHGLEIVIARCFSFVGADLPKNAHFAIGNFLRDALAGEDITVRGDGTDVRSYLDQRDLAHWLFTLLLKGGDGHAYNVGSDVAITIAGLASLVRDLVAPKKAVHVLSQSQDVGIRSRYVPDISKAQNSLGLQVSIPLTKAILIAAESNR